MKDLQSFDFDKSQYERANQKWECGNRVNGKTCPQGSRAVAVDPQTLENTPGAQKGGCADS